MKNAGTIVFLLTGIFILLSVNAVAAVSSKDELQRGIIIDSVVAQSDPAQSYSLYLPSNYAKDKKWALLYAFDPGGSGKRPVEIFQGAAERYGYIVVGSNNSQNGLGSEALSQIIKALWIDTHERFNINDERIYAAGFSGGARVANRWAVSCQGCIAGVISSGGGLSSNTPTDEKLPYVVFGTAGIDDFNYSELRNLDNALANASVPHRLALFEGAHQWLTKPLTFDAFEWLNLQAMKAGKIKRDARFIEDYISREKAKTLDLEKSNNFFELGQAYKNIIGDFEGFYKTDDIKEKLAALQGRREYRESQKQEKDSLTKQSAIVNRVVAIIQPTDAPVDILFKKESLQNIKLEIENLKIKAKQIDDSIERRIARRSLGHIFAIAIESAMFTNITQKKYGAMADSLELARLVYPQDAGILFNLSRAYALKGQKKDSIKILGQAVEAGFNDCKRIKENAEFETLLTEKEFLKLTEKLSCQ